MALSRRPTQRFNTAIWPGFVDAMTGLLLVLMFVLTIFMVIQFVLREEISGQASLLSEQENQLNSLSDEVAGLASALGLANTENAGLNARLTDRDDQLDSQRSELANMRTERALLTARLAEQMALGNRLQDELTTAQSEITGFEAQVAGLLAQQSEAVANIAELESREASLLTQQEALNLALAQARDEIDEGVESARLAAAQREALESMIADLEQTQELDTATIARLEASQAAGESRITELEAARLAEIAAAQALRDRLENADTELTAMTLALEEQRKEAEETLTLLAATQGARDDLTTNLAAALLAQQTAEAETGELSAQLDAILAEQGSNQEALNARLANEEALQAQLAAALAAQQESDQTAEGLQNDLAAALLARERLQTVVDDLSGENADVATTMTDLREDLAAALAAQDDLTSEADRQAALLAQANTQLSQEEALSAEAQRQVALLNEQVLELRNQVGTLQTLLDVASEADENAQVQIAELGTQLNTALARATAEERRARLLEEAARLKAEEENALLAAEALNLQRFRSDFFGKLREVLEGQDGVQIVGDRFVFSSEVLFAAGQAELSPQGEAEIANVASILRQISDEIPSDIDWVIRVDGHTDNVPVSGAGAYQDNWELSQARALSVVRFMQDSQGIAPQRLAANGFGEYQPLNPENSAEARAQNRRIELKLTER